MPQTFSPVYRGIISVGDKVGSVEKIFPRLRLYLETQKKIKDKLLGSLIYPAIVLTTAFLTFIAMIFFVFPKLKLMFEDFGGDAAIQLQNNISKMEIIFIVLISIVLIFFIFIMIIAFFSKKNVNLKLKKDNFILKLPIIGNFSTYFETLNFSFAMETLTAGGVTIENAINESKSVISNEKYKQSLTEVNKRILKGEPLSEAFSNYKVFPEYMTKWLYVGERSGKTE